MTWKASTLRVFLDQGSVRQTVEGTHGTEVAGGEAACSVRRIHNVALRITVRQSEGVPHLMGCRK